MSQQHIEQPLTEVLLALRSQVESIAAMKNAGSTEDEQLKQIYYNELTPNLLELRKRQRLAIDQAEEGFRKIKSLNQELVNLKERCDCVVYEALVKHPELEATSKSPMKNGCDSFNPDEISELDHETRMRMLEEEEARRKDLVDKMNKLNDETTKIAQLNAECASEMNEVIPYIKQLVEKVSPPTLMPTPDGGDSTNMD